MSKGPWWRSAGPGPRWASRHLRPLSPLPLDHRNLDLSKFCIGQKEEQLPSYDLYAVINHYGGMIGGHYTACARLPNDRSSQRSDVGEGTRPAGQVGVRGGRTAHTLPTLPQAGACLTTAQ